MPINRLGPINSIAPLLEQTCWVLASLCSALLLYEWCHMRSNEFAFPLAATTATAFFFLAAIFMVSGLARADDASGRAQCTCPESGGDARTSVRPKYADLKAGLDINDEIATLETLQKV